MNDIARFSLKAKIAFIILVFLAWCLMATAWYVCGVNNLCTESLASAVTAETLTEVTIQFSDSQLPLGAVYDRSGAAADILIMLLVAFVLGALLGRPPQHPARRRIFHCSPFRRRIESSHTRTIKHPRAH
jgi:hypothetical protein